MKPFAVSLIAIITAVLSLFGYMHLESTMLEVTRTDFSNGAGNLKIMHITDVHIDFMRVPHQKIFDCVKREKADIIILTGDYNGRRGYMPQFEEFIGRLTAEAYEAGAKMIYACLGNHDYAEYTGVPGGPAELIGILRTYGIEVLINRTAVFEQNGRKYNITGFDDLTNGHPDIGLALSTLSADTQANIGISHNPYIVTEIPEGSIDYLFAGHLHGGQIWLPFNLGLILLQKEVPGQEGFKQGLYDVNGIKVYVNRGIGNVIVPLRFLSIPEISVYIIP